MAKSKSARQLARAHRVYNLVTKEWLRVTSQEKMHRYNIAYFTEWLGRCEEIGLKAALIELEIKNATYREWLIHCEKIAKEALVELGKESE